MPACAALAEQRLDDLEQMICIARLRQLAVVSFAVEVLRSVIRSSSALRSRVSV